MAILAGHVTEAALGYFITPIVTVLLGVVLLREKLRPAQWTTLRAGLRRAVLVLAINYGSFPWIALALAFYVRALRLTKKSVGGAVDALTGLTIETAWGGPRSPWPNWCSSGRRPASRSATSSLHPNTLLLLNTSVGAVTAIPLLLFAASARRLRLSTMV